MDHQQGPNQVIALQKGLEVNKRNAIAFYQMAYLGHPVEAVEQYVGDEYRQHNPVVGDEQGKIVEHWDAIQSIPAQSKNGNLMY